MIALKDIIEEFSYLYDLINKILQSQTVIDVLLRSGLSKNLIEAEDLLSTPSSLIGNSNK